MESKEVKTALISNGERVTLTDRKRNLGHGEQTEVIYSDGSTGWEHTEGFFDNELPESKILPIANNISNPLILNWTGLQYKVNKPLDQSGEYIDKPLVLELVKALHNCIETLEAVNYLQGGKLFPQVLPEAREALKKATA